MIAEIGSLLTSVNAAYTIAKGINALKSDVDRNESISKILEVLISVQFQTSSMLAKAHELEIEKHDLTKKIMDFEKWSETETQYELKEIASGIFVYSYKPTIDPTKPKHWLCTNCYKDKIKSIIRLSFEGDSANQYACPNCKDNFSIRHTSSGSSSPFRGSGGPNSWMGS